MRAQKLRRRCKRQEVGVVLGVILAIKKMDNALALTGVCAGKEGPSQRASSCKVGSIMSL
jgi:hypothetical protein